jgi:hypothetical protein
MENKKTWVRPQFNLVDVDSTASGPYNASVESGTYGS